MDRPADAAVPLLFDVSRLCTRALNPTPNGIDRLDALLARGLLGTSRHASALMFGLGGPRLASPSAAFAAFERTERAWREAQSPERDGEAVVSLTSALTASTCTRRRPRWAPPAIRRLGAGLATLATFGIAGGTAPESGAARGAAYVNAAHFPLEWPSHVAWLTRRPDIKPVILIHDLLPLDHPDWFWRAERDRHRARVAFLAASGAGAIVTSRAVEARLADELRRAGRRDLPILRAAPPVAAAFRVPRTSDPGLAAARYFVACGTIEPRKNHALLVRLWRRLASERRAATPKLVVVGKRGWLCDALVAEMDDLARSGSLVLVHGLPSGAYRALLDDSLGLLAPSLAEGYGLPMAEALARGVPVIASDIPPFREQGAAVFIDPLDDRAWYEAITALAEAGPCRHRPAPAVTERDYLAAVRGFLAALA